MHKTVIKVISGILALSPEQINPQAFLNTELMADFLDRVEISMALEDEFSLDISDAEIEKWRTVQDIIDFIDHEAIA